MSPKQLEYEPPREGCLSERDIFLKALAESVRMARRATARRSRTSTNSGDLAGAGISVSQEYVAAVADIGRSQLSRIEKGHAMPTVFTVFKIAAAVGVPASVLMKAVEDRLPQGYCVAPELPYPFDSGASKRQKVPRRTLLTKVKGVPSPRTMRR